MSHPYQLYGADLISSVRFDGLDELVTTDATVSADPDRCSISIVRGRVAVPRRPPDHRFTTTGSPDGPVWLERYEQQSSSILAFPGLLRAQLGDDVITIDPEVGIEDASVEHLVLDNVIPLALVRQGLIVLHGGAVQLPSGRCVAFVGPSGAGKSTLVAGVNLAGLGLVSDDCLVVRDTDGSRQLAAGHRRSRLLESSIDLLGAASSGTVAPMTAKRWVRAAASIDERSMSLDAIVVLDTPHLDSSATDRTGSRPTRGRVQRIRPSEALVELIRHSFHRPHDRRAAAASFGDLATLARRIPGYRMVVGEGSEGVAAVAALLEDADRSSAGQSDLEIDVGPISGVRARVVGACEELVGS